MVLPAAMDPVDPQAAGIAVTDHPDRPAHMDPVDHLAAGTDLDRPAHTGAADLLVARTAAMVHRAPQVHTAAVGRQAASWFITVRQGITVIIWKLHSSHLPVMSKFWHLQ